MINVNSAQADLTRGAVDLLPGWASALTPVGVILLAVILIMTGRLVPKRVVDRWLTIKDDEINAAQKRESVLLEIVLRSEETRKDVAEQLRAQQITGDLSLKILQALPHIENEAGRAS